MSSLKILTIITVATLAVTVGIPASATAQSAQHGYLYCCSAGSCRLEGIGVNFTAGLFSCPSNGLPLVCQSKNCDSTPQERENIQTALQGGNILTHQPAELQQCDASGKMPCVAVGCTGPAIRAKGNRQVPALDHEWVPGEPGGKCGIYISCPKEVNRIQEAWEKAHPHCCSPPYAPSACQ